MDDSDDYFDESLELDEAALAAIQATEERFGAASSMSQVQSRPSPSSGHSPQRLPSPPPPKRLKTSHNWVNSTVSHVAARAPSDSRIARLPSMDMNPEIRLGPDGNYMIGSQSKPQNKTLDNGRGSVQTEKPVAPTLGAFQGRNCVPNASRGTDQASYGSTYISFSDSHSGPSRAPQHSYHLHQDHHVPPSDRLSHQQLPQSQEPRPSQPQILQQKRNLVRRVTTSAAQPASEGFGLSASQKRTRLIEQALAENSAPSQYSSQNPVSEFPRDVPPLSQPDPPSPHTGLAFVRDQLAEMRATNEAIQQSLREAQDAQLTKAGEVSFLRQAIEKAKKEHAEVVAKAKADAIAHEKVKAELQAKLKEEAERAATRLIFKQHELETSARKPTWGSVRQRHVSKDTVAATPTRSNQPIPPPSTIRLAQPSQSHLGLNDQMDDAEGPFSSPTGGHKPTRPNEGSKRPRFKGFYNAFTDSQPLPIDTPTRVGRRNVDVSLGGGLSGESSDEVRHVNMPDVRGDKGKNKEVLETPVWDQAEEIRDVVESMSIVEDDAGQEGDGRVEEGDVSVEEGIDWGEELRRIVFSHVAPKNDVLTLHIILSTALPPELAPKEKHVYATACQVILETCGAKHGYTQYLEDSGWEIDVVSKVAHAFVTVCDVLNNAACISPLLALFDLLMLLTLYIPAFLSPFLRPAPTNDRLDHSVNPGRPSHLLSVLCDVVRNHLVPPNHEGEVEKKDEETELRSALAVSVVQLMESLCWNVKDGLVEQLGIIPSRPHVLQILLDRAQASEVIARTLRLLILLASQRNLFRFLLAPPEPDTVESQASLHMDDGFISPLLERLSYYLIEPVVEDSHNIRLLVITVISILSDSHADVGKVFCDSVSLAPSLVICVTKLSRLLWEEDLQVIESHGLARTHVETLYSSVTLLHHLVFALDLSTVLSRRLVEATRLPGPYNGVTHMFIVTFGRLSWADCPDWLDDECRGICEAIAELAMEIIEVVVTGPECDSLWAVWHQNEADEEEDEAQCMEIE